MAIHKLPKMAKFGFTTYKLPKLAKTRFTKSYHKWLLNIEMTVELNGHCLYVEKLLQHSQAVGKDREI